MPGTLRHQHQISLIRTFMVAKKRISCKSPQRKEHVRMPGLDNSEMRELQPHVNEIREQDTE